MAQNKQKQVKQDKSSKARQDKMPKSNDTNKPVNLPKEKFSTTPVNVTGKERVGQLPRDPFPEPLPAMHSTTGGLAPQYLEMTKMDCRVCKRAKLGVIKDLGQGQLCLECCNLSCRATIHTKRELMTDDSE